MTQTRKLTAGAAAVALATVLSFITLFRAPYGGSVTAGSMVPLVLYAMMAGTGWGMTASLAYAAVQMLLGFYPPPTPTLLGFVLVVLLDYGVAFGGLGLAEVIGRPFGSLRFAAGAAGVSALRFAAHFVSGILIWGSYAPAGQPVWLYSLTYNGGYMLCEAAVTVAFTVLVTRSLSPERLWGERGAA